jgi:hypothetical protein
LAKPGHDSLSNPCYFFGTLDRLVGVLSNSLLSDCSVLK